MIGEGIHEEVLRALVEQHAVRYCLVARIDGGPDWGCRFTWAGAAHLGQPDRGGAFCRQRRPERIQCRAVTGDSFKTICSVPTTSGPFSLIHVP